jgi:PAS domain S-box-containing protein
MDLFAGIFESIPDAVLVVERSGMIRHANRQAHQMFVVPEDGLLGLPIERLIPHRFARGHDHHRERYLHGAQLRPMGKGLELQAMRSDGSEFAVDVMLSPMRVGDDQIVLCVVRDVTTQRQDEQRLRDSLQEKETLLKEIHHRVKNNLAVISSLLYLQSRRTSDPETANVLEESQRRIRSMALVHETLYRSGSLAAVEFAAYAEALCKEVQNSHMDPAQDIRVTVDTVPVQMPIDIAVPCALILNELLVNAFKHAFTARATGEIRLGISETAEGETCIVVADNGVGGLVASEHGLSLGITLISSLSRQIDARHVTESDDTGTRVTLLIPRAAVLEQRES